MSQTDRDDLNYLGVFFLIGQNRTPFLNMMGGLGNGRRVKSFQFPVNQNSSLSSASQNTSSETSASGAGTATTYTRTQVYNVTQIMKNDVQVTYAKESASGEFSGLNVSDPTENEIASELDFQKTMGMQQMALDTEYSFIQGSFSDSGTAGTNQKTRGIVEAISANAVNASSTDLDKDGIQELTRTMASNGAPFSNPVVLVNGFQLQQLSDTYGFAPTDRTVGGVAIKQIVTDFATLGVVYTPQMPTNALVIVDMTYCRPVFLPFKSRNDGSASIMSFEDVDFSGAKYGGFWYMQTGLDYGHEKFHGKITNLTTS